ncbi:MAG: hypothetical protein RMK29_00010 [Myxococcales bacterium]|nr:hypothetical protein [Myxococcota bacterium]MDW8280058.1 hypothetical protein [Myxococcales bacterium]
MRTPRTLLPAVLGLLLLAAGPSGCNKEEQERRYCDSLGCYACVGDRCYPVPGDPVRPDPSQVMTCDNDSACGTGRVCNLGRCEAACTDHSSCRSGNVCISGRCRPADSAQCGVVGALCTDASQCGAGRTCVDRACAKLCPDQKCPLGQVCKDGACVEDPSPQVAQCTYDHDCDAGTGAFRCVNAYCLPRCTTNETCTNGASCIKGLCRADRRAG